MSIHLHIKNSCVEVDQESVAVRSATSCLGMIKLLPENTLAIFGCLFIVATAMLKPQRFL